MKLSRKTKTAIFWIVGVLAYAMFYQIYYNLMDDKTIWPYRDSTEAFNYIIRNTLAIFLIFSIDWLIVFKMTNRTLSTPVKIVVDMVFAAVTLIAFNAIYTLAFQMARLDWIGTIFNSVMTMLALEAAYYTERYLHMMKERETLNARLKEYRYMALKQQVNPHFLFNSLNILYSLVRNRSDKSLEFIESLSNIYRYVLRHQNTDLVLVEEELEFVKEYIKILSLRYVDQLNVVYLMPCGMPERHIVPFTLQLLVENVVKHNVMTKAEPMTITISLLDGKMYVSNPKFPKKETLEGGTGLKYLSQLYEVHACEFRVYDEKEIFKAEVPLIDTTLRNTAR